MRLSVETLGLIGRFGAEKSLAMIRDAGFDCVDFSYTWRITTPEELSPYIGEDFVARAREIRAELDRVGLCCNQVHAPFRPMSDAHVPLVIRAIEGAAILGAPHIVVHPRWCAEEMERYNVAYFKALEPVCREFGVRIAIENLFHREKPSGFSGIFHTPEAMRSLLERLDSPWFGVCCDTGHAVLTGTQPADLIRGLPAGALLALHVQDNDGVDDRHTLPFLGKLDWESVMAALRDTGYRGDLTFEIYKYLRAFPDDLVFDALCHAARVGRGLIAKFEE